MVVWGIIVGHVYILTLRPFASQWHAFSLVAHPSLPNHSLICMSMVGEQHSWTRTVHRLLSTPSHRPGYIYGPFPSPYSDATNYDNLIAVASGIGITPALSAVVNLKDQARVHVIWACRDPDLIGEFVSALCSVEPHIVEPHIPIGKFYTESQRKVCCH